MHLSLIVISLTVISHTAVAHTAVVHSVNSLAACLSLDRCCSLNAADEEEFGLQDEAPSTTGSELDCFGIVTLGEQAACYVSLLCLTTL